jgi:hypothetical protein
MMHTIESLFQLRTCPPVEFAENAIHRPGTLEVASLKVWACNFNHFVMQEMP